MVAVGTRIALRPLPAQAPARKPRAERLPRVLASKRRQGSGWSVLIGGKNGSTTRMKRSQERLAFWLRRRSILGQSHLLHRSRMRLRNSALIALSLARMHFLIVLRAR